MPFSFFDCLDIGMRAKKSKRWRRGWGREESPNFHMLKTAKNAQNPTEMLTTQANNNPAVGWSRASETTPKDIDSILLDMTLMYCTPMDFTALSTRLNWT